MVSLIPTKIHFLNFTPSTTAQLLLRSQTRSLFFLEKSPTNMPPPKSLSLSASAHHQTVWWSKRSNIQRKWFSFLSCRPFLVRPKVRNGRHQKKKDLASLRKRLKLGFASNRKSPKLLPKEGLYELKPNPLNIFLILLHCMHLENETQIRENNLLQ